MQVSWGPGGSGGQGGAEAGSAARLTPPLLPQAYERAQLNPPPPPSTPPHPLLRQVWQRGVRSSEVLSEVPPLFSAASASSAPGDLLLGAARCDLSTLCVLGQVEGWYNVVPTPGPGQAAVGQLKVGGVLCVLWQRASCPMNARSMGRDDARSSVHSSLPPPHPIAPLSPLHPPTVAHAGVTDPVGPPCRPAAASASAHPAATASARRPRHLGGRPRQLACACCGCTRAAGWCWCCRAPLGLRG